VAVTFAGGGGGLAVPPLPSAADTVVVKACYPPARWPRRRPRGGTPPRRPAGALAPRRRRCRSVMVSLALALSSQLQPGAGRGQSGPPEHDPAFSPPAISSSPPARHAFSFCSCLGGEQAGELLHLVFVLVAHTQTRMRRVQEAWRDRKEANCARKHCVKPCTPPQIYMIYSYLSKGPSFWCRNSERIRTGLAIVKQPTHPFVGTGGMSCRRPRDSSRPVPRVGPHRTRRQG